MAKLHYIGRTDHLVNFTCNSSVEELCVWYKAQSVVQFDTETNVTTSISTREAKLFQFGNVAGDEVFVVQWSFLSEEDREKLRDLLRISHIQKIAHNASFEYQICLKENIVLENVWDTMVMEKCLYPGYDYDLRFFALAAVLLRRYGIDVSKEQQTEFGDDIITDEKLIYAATDVVHLGRLKQDQRNDLIKEDLLQLAEGEYNENDVVLAFADMEFYGMGFNPEKWRTNIDKAEPIVKQATEDLTAILLQEPYYSLGQNLICNAKLTDSDGAERKVELPAILPKDMFTVNWNSSTQVLKILKLIWPNMEKASALELKKFLQENDPLAPKYSPKTLDEINEIEKFLTEDKFHEDDSEERTSDITVALYDLAVLKDKFIGLTSKEFSSYLETPSKDWFLIIKLLLNKQYSVLEKALSSNLKTQLVESKFLLPKDTVTINWNSNNTKLEVFKWFNPKVENTDADTVEDNIHLPFFQAYKKYNNANSLLTKFGEKFITDHVDSDGRVRTRYDTILSTGRVSSSSPKICWAA
jgi:ribonuclease D